jgi:BolA protein
LANLKQSLLAKIAYDKRYESKFYLQRNLMQVAQHIEMLLKGAFQPTALEIHDDSAKHAGHREVSASGQSHFSVLIVSEQFAGLSPVKRHQEVYRILMPLIHNPIHALALKVYTPVEYAKRV